MPCGKKSEYSALRAMATNIHSLHTATEQKLSSKCEKYIEAADLVGILYDLNTNRCVYSTARSSAADIKVALDWATPHVNWPHLVFSNTNTKREEPYVSSSSSVVSEISRNTIFSSAATATIAANNSRVDVSSAETRKEILAIAFESQYATTAISSVCQKTHSVLEMGAFSHSLSGYGYDVDDALDALEYVRDYINN